MKVIIKDTEKNKPYMTFGYNVDMAYGIDEDRIPDAPPDNQSEV